MKEGFGDEKDIKTLGFLLLGRFKCVRSCKTSHLQVVLAITQYGLVGPRGISRVVDTALLINTTMQMHRQRKIK